MFYKGFHVDSEDGTIQVALYSTRKINLGDQLLINYGTAYWEGVGVVPLPLNPTTFQLDANDHVISLNS